MQKTENHFWFSVFLCSVIQIKVAHSLEVGAECRLVQDILNLLTTNNEGIFPFFALCYNQSISEMS